MIFTGAKEVLKDNRIGPKETREVLHRFALTAEEPKTAEVALIYEILTPDIAPGLGSIDIPFARVVVPLKEETTWRFFAFVALAATCLALAAAIVLRRRRP